MRTRLLTTHWTRKGLAILLSLPIMALVNLDSFAWAGQKMAFQPSGSPRKTLGGGARPAQLACGLPSAAQKTSFKALVPGQYVGLTQAARPTLMVHLSQTGAKAVEFSLFDAQMNGVYQVTVPIDEHSGLIKFQLPDNGPTLAMNQPYYWAVAMICNPTRRTQDWIVGGWIERQEPSRALQQQLKQATPLEQAALYAQAGFWYEAVNRLVDLKQQTANPTPLEQSWTELLASVGLGTIDLQTPETRMLSAQ